MKVLKYESCDKTCRIIEDVDINEVSSLLTSDNGLVEAISTHDSRILVRLFFDIDTYNMKNDPLNEAILILNNFFRCSTDQWAVATSSREDKYSYHIVSRSNCCTLRDLRQFTQNLNSISDIFDPRMLCCSLDDPYECIYFRLPNQSKKVIHKSSPPLKILSGELLEFVISDVRGLNIIKL